MRKNTVAFQTSTTDRWSGTTHRLFRRGYRLQYQRPELETDLSEFSLISGPIICTTYACRPKSKSLIYIAYIYMQHAGGAVNSSESHIAILFSWKLNVTGNRCEAFLSELIERFWRVGSSFLFKRYLSKHPPCSWLCVPFAIDVPVIALWSSFKHQLCSEKLV